MLLAQIQAIWISSGEPDNYRDIAVLPTLGLFPTIYRYSTIGITDVPLLHMVASPILLYATY